MENSDGFIIIESIDIWEIIPNFAGKNQVRI